MLMVQSHSHAIRVIQVAIGAIIELAWMCAGDLRIHPIQARFPHMRGMITPHT